MEDQTITWVQILQVGGLAGVISALFSALFGGLVKEFFEHRERTRKAQHLALKLSLVLESYYHACRDRVYDIENYHSSYANAGSNDVGLPDITEYPDDPVAWVYLEKTVADEVLSFPAAIQAIDEGIKFNAYSDHMPDGPDPEWTLEPLYEMAFRSIELARRVRSEHRIVETNRTHESETHLKQSRDRFLTKLTEQRERRQQEMPLV